MLKRIKHGISGILGTRAAKLFPAETANSRTQEENGKNTKPGFFHDLLNKVSDNLPFKALRQKMTSKLKKNDKLAETGNIIENITPFKVQEDSEGQNEEAIRNHRQAQLQAWMDQVATDASKNAIAQICALRLQCWWRTILAQRYAAELRTKADQEALIKLQEMWRMEQLRKQAREQFQQMLKTMARQVYEQAVDHLKFPLSAIIIQKHWRSHRARRHVAKILGKHRKNLARQKETERFYAALRKMREEADLHYHEAMDPALRRKFGREDWEATEGWKPKYKADGEYALQDYIWSPPEGERHGLRTHKVTLPAQTAQEKRRLMKDPNTWVGLPVYVEPIHLKEEKHVGPWPPRLDTTLPFGTNLMQAGTLKRPSSQQNLRYESNGSSYFITKYTWLPAALVTESNQYLEQSMHTTA